MFDTLLFDLDGTLTNSYEGIANSVLYALERMGLPTVGEDILSKFIGPPLTYSFKTYCGMDDGQAERALKFYRERYSDVGWAENRVYDGIPEALQKLKAMSKTMFVATSKPEKFARNIVERFELLKYFDEVFGATFDSSRDTKDKVVKYAIDSARTDKVKTVMIGDREHDVFGAKSNGIKSIGVLYGFGDLAELKAAGADYIAPTPDDICALV